MISDNRIHSLITEHTKLKKEIYDPNKMSDRRYYSEISKRFKELEIILNCYDKIQNLKKSISENKKLIKIEDDEELKMLAQEEIDNAEQEILNKTEELKELLIPKDANDDKDAIVEIRAGTGGEEAALFVADLFRMYTYFAEKQGWKQTLISSNPTGVGGFKEIIFSLSGDDVFGTMRFGVR